MPAISLKAVARGATRLASALGTLVLISACGDSATGPTLITPTPTPTATATPATPTPSPTATPTPKPTATPTPTPAPTPETSARAQLARVEVRTQAGEIAPCCPSSRAYACWEVACAIWVYATSPGVPSRTILVETPNEYLLPPRSTRTRESDIPAHRAVKVHTAQLDAAKIIAAGGAMGASGVYEFGVRMTETSVAWGTHTEATSVKVDMECYDELPWECK